MSNGLMHANSKEESKVAWPEPAGKQAGVRRWQDISGSGQSTRAKWQRPEPVPGGRQEHNYRLHSLKKQLHMIQVQHTQRLEQSPQHHRPSQVQSSLHRQKHLRSIACR
jgi:hypothetical protein